MTTIANRIIRNANKANFDLTIAILDIAAKIADNGGQAFFVGGCVRDFFLNTKTNDIDIVVEGMGFDKLDSILKTFGETKQTGKEFLVIKINIEGQEFDFSIARDETSTGDGFKNFKINPASLIEDLTRRDITINAMAINILTGELIDPFGGQADIENRIIRHTSAKFTESSERPLRLMQILARNPEFTIHPDTIAICAGMSDKFASIDPSQIAAQFTKLFEKGKRPGMGIMFLKTIGFIEHFPSLEALDGLPQSAKHHPEGDALIHTCMTMDAMSAICNREGIDGTQRMKLIATAIAHDMGKPETTDTTGDDITSKGHASATDAAIAFLNQIGIHQGMIKAIIALTREHMAIMQGKITPKAIKRIARRLNEATGADTASDDDKLDIRKTATLNDLCFIFEADASARSADREIRLIGQTGAIAKFREIAEALKLDDGQKPTSLITGENLIAMGMKPGKHFGKILKAITEAEESGKINTEAEALEMARGMA